MVRSPLYRPVLRALRVALCVLVAALVVLDALTTFCVSLTFYFLFYKGAVPERRAFALGTSVFTLGVTVGAYWEIFEWFFVGKYTMADTISDLLVDSAAALAAALALRRSGDRLT